jgi:N-acetylneuraminic acid mutarotase
METRRLGLRGSGRRLAVLCVLGVLTALCGPASDAPAHVAHVPTANLAAADTGTYGVLVSTSAQRTSPMALAGQTVSGKIHAFTSPDTVDIVRVRFWLDDTAMTGAPRRTETTAPYDFAGGSASTATAFDTATLANGTHTITAAVDLANATSAVVHSTFTVQNGTVAHALLRSTSASRTAPTTLAGATVSGNVYAFVKPDSGVIRVRFYVDDPNRTAAPHRTESMAPWDLAGGDAAAAAPFDTTKLADGQHTVTAAVDRSTGGTTVLNAAFTVDNNAMPPPGFQLMHSASPDRSNPVALASATVSGSLYAFVKPDSGASQVRFYVDNPSASGTPYRTESTAPWDLAGGSATASAPFDTRTLSNGSHTVTASVSKSAGGTELISAAFTVSNSTAPPPPPPSDAFAWTTKAPAPLARFEAQGADVGGRVYVMGGFHTTDIKATTASHSYDVAANAWAQVASMPTPLTHAGVAVDGTDIYVAGGFVGNHPGQAVAEVWRYDTVANQWYAFVALPEARAAGALARVGRTLHFFGGMNTARSLDYGTHWTLDLDATSPAWVQRAPIPDPRNHLAGVTFGGRACALGGQYRENEATGNRPSFNCYDAGGNTWDTLPAMPAPRGHIGGSTFVMDGRLVVVGGTLNGDVKSAEVIEYDPQAREWLSLPPLPAGRKHPIAGIVGKTLYSSTGNGGTGTTPTTTTWTGSLANRWEVRTPMPVALGEVAGGIIGGRLYTVGEGNSGTFAYNLALGTWTGSGLASRPLPGHHHPAETVGGRLYLLGGLGGAQGKVQIYDPLTNVWTAGAEMPFAAGSSASAVIAGKIYVAGGIVGSSTTPQAAVYDPATNSWSPIAPMPQGRNHAAAATDGAKLYVFGGRGQGSGDSNVVANGFDTVQVYDPTTNAWRSSANPGSGLAPLPQARGGMGKAVWYGGEFYVIGGETLNGSGATAAGVYSRVDVYDPVTNSWRLGTSMPTARHGIFPLVLAGRIHVAGGGIQAAFSSSTKLEIYSPG